MATEMSENERAGVSGGDRVSGPLTRNEDSVGTILRRARKAQGERSVAEIAEEIRVRPHQLEALEADDYERLPGLIYAAGFIRSYAQYLNLDGEELVVRFKRTARTENLEAHLTFPEPLEDPRIPRRSLVAIACTLAIAVYGTWYGFSSRGDAGFEDVPTVESRLAGAVDKTAGAEPAPAAAARAAAAGPEMIEVAAAPRPLPQKRPSGEPEAVTAPVALEPADEPVAAAEVAPAPMEVAAADSGQITVRARKDAWVRIEGPDAAPVIDRVLKAGEAYDAPAGQGLYMMTGNAGALDILVDGKHIGSLGPQGAIRRHVALDMSLLKPAPRVRRQ